MGILSERCIPELQALVVSTLSLPSTSIVVRATKFVRFDWRQLIEYFEQNIANAGLQPPWTIIRIGPEEEADWGMAVNAFTVPAEIFFIEDERNEVVSSSLLTANSNTQRVANNTGFFVGQRLLWQTAQQYGIIQTITPTIPFTTLGLDTIVNATNTEIVSSDISSDVHGKVELVRTALYRGGTFTNFQIVEDPVIDVSDINPVNEIEQHENFNLLAGSVFVKLLVGDF